MRISPAVRRKERYTNFVSNSRRLPENTIVQQDGALSNNYLEVRKYLDRKLPNRWTEEVVQLSGFHALQILLLSTYFYGLTSNAKYTVKLRGLLYNGTQD